MQNLQKSMHLFYNRGV